MDSYKTIRNRSVVREAVCLYKGRQYILPAGAEEAFPTSVADAFMSQSAEIEAVEHDIGQLLDAEDNDGFVYIGNTTGDPDAPDEVQITVHDKMHGGRPRLESIANPKKAPQTLKRVAQGAQGVIQLQSGPWGTNEGSFTHVLPPYSVKKFDPATGAWFLRREGARDAPGGAHAIKARRLPAWRPDKSWPYNEIVDWLELHDYTLVGQLETEEEIKARCERDGHSFSRELQTALATQLKRVFFRAMDPKYTLYSPAQLAEYQRAKVADAKEQADAEALPGSVEEQEGAPVLKRGPGRPPKQATA